MFDPDKPDNDTPIHDFYDYAPDSSEGPEHVDQVAEMRAEQVSERGGLQSDRGQHDRQQGRSKQPHRGGVNAFGIDEGIVYPVDNLNEAADVLRQHGLKVETGVGFLGWVKSWFR